MSKDKNLITGVAISLIIGFLIGLLIFNGSGYDRGYDKGFNLGKESVVPANVQNCAGFCTPANSVNCVPFFPTPKVCEVCGESEKDYVGLAIDDFMNEVEDDEELQECDGEEYDFNQIKVKTIYDSYSVEYDDEDYTVDFKIKLKYLDIDTEEKCYKTYNVSVFYETGEDPVVSW